MGFDETSSLGETICELNLCSMPNGFFPIETTFENEIEELVFMNGDEVIEDKYGKKLRYTSVEKLLKVLYKCESEEHYRRTELAINTLKTFLSDDEESVIHALEENGFVEVKKLPKIETPRD